MYKKYIVRLTDCERQLLGEVVRKLKGTSEKVRRAQVLLKADADGPHGKDAHIAEACDCRVRTIEHVRQRLVVEGLDAALERAKRDTPPTPKLRLLPISLRPRSGTPWRWLDVSGTLAMAGRALGLASG